MSVDWEEILETAMKQMYSETMLDHGRNPRNLGDLEETNAFGIVNSPCGDTTMAMWLKVEDNKIADIGFTTDGCMTTLATGSITTEMAKGKTLIDAGQISQQDISDALEGLPKAIEHCALLAVDTLREAIANYQTETGVK
ncbi:MAG TPA: iron-sulfur cluster assembly scaffold protein [Dehalococcoidales bacterium]|nr:iron-sulfur cluster assembly scaffold protein [Dehalococcoidales bacterium]